MNTDEVYGGRTERERERDRDRKRNRHSKTDRGTGGWRGGRHTQCQTAGAGIVGWFTTIFWLFSDFRPKCPTLSDPVRLCLKWFPNWCRGLFHSIIEIIQAIILAWSGCMRAVRDQTQKLETACSIQEFRGMALGLIFGVSSVIFAPLSPRMFGYTLWDCPLMYS